jgi:polyphenol oxidase
MRAAMSIEAPDFMAPPIGPDEPWPRTVGAITTTRDAVQPGASALGSSRGRYARLNLATHVGDDAEAVAANRRALHASLGLARVQWLDQVHGRTCFEADARTLDTVPQADAAWTRERGLALAVLTADCVPVVIADRRGSLVAVAHAGWRGLVAGVLSAVVESLPEQPADLTAWLGPAIGPSAYEVGEEVVAAIAALPDGVRMMESCARPSGGSRRFLLDLFELSGQLLKQAGVSQVASERLCTHTDRRFYSYRRDGVTGRMATLAWLKE